MAKYIARTLEGDSDPITADDLRGMARDGRLKPEDMVRRDDDQRWHRASGIKGLFPQAPVRREPDPPVETARPVEVIERVVHAPPVYRPEIRVDIKRKGSSLGVAGLIMGIIAFLICWIPLVGALGIPLSALGLLVGLLGMLIALARKGAGIGYPIASIAVSGLALAIAVAINGAIFSGATAIAESASRELTRIVDEQNAAAGAQVGVGEDPLDPTAETGAPSKPAEPEEVWAGLANTVGIGDTRVRIERVALGKVPLADYSGRRSSSEEDRLMVAVRISNTSPAKILTYQSFDGGRTILGDSAKLSDEHGNAYRRSGVGYSTKIVGRVEFEDIRPGSSVTDLLVFTPPVEAATVLRLELPARMIGEKGWIRFEFPVSAIERE